MQGCSWWSYGGILPPGHLKAAQGTPCSLQGLMPNTTGLGQTLELLETRGKWHSSSPFYKKKAKVTGCSKTHRGNTIKADENPYLWKADQCAFSLFQTATQSKSNLPRKELCWRYHRPHITYAIILGTMWTPGPVQKQIYTHSALSVQDRVWVTVSVFQILYSPVLLAYSFLIPTGMAGEKKRHEWMGETHRILMSTS